MIIMLSKIFNNFIKKLKNLFQKILVQKIYYIKTIEVALKLIKRKFNNIIFITNGNNNGRDIILN